MTITLDTITAEILKAIMKKEGKYAFYLRYIIYFRVKNNWLRTSGDGKI